MAPDGGTRPHLSRELDFKENVFLAVSSAAPAGSVFMFAPVLIGSLGSASVLALLLAAVVAVCGGMCYGELAATYPIAGGEYTWAARLLGRPVGFALFLLILVSGPAVLATQGTAASEYLGDVWPAAHGRVTCLVLIALATAIAILNVRTNSWITAAFLLLEVFVLVAVVVLGFTAPARGLEAFTTPQIKDVTGALRDFEWRVVLPALPVAFTALWGFQNGVYFAEETTGSTRRLGHAVLVALAVMVVLELVPVIAVIIGAPSLPHVMAAASPIGEFVRARGGRSVGQAVNVGIVIALLNTMIVVVNVFARVLFSSGRDRSWPGDLDALFGTIHGRWRTPVVATILVGTVAMAASFLPFPWLIATVACVAVVQAGAVGACALRVRRAGRGSPDGYRMPGWPLPAVVLVAATIGLAYRSSQDTPSSFAVSAVTMALGLVYYYGYIHPRRHERWILSATLTQGDDGVDGPDSRNSHTLSA